MASDDSPAIKALEDEIEAIRQAQAPTRRQIAELESELADGDRAIKRNEAALRILRGEAAVTRGRSAGGTGGGRRPRGQMKDAILAFVRANPGATAAQVAQAVGGSKPSVTSSLQKYANDGELTKERLGGRSVGFKIAA